MDGNNDACSANLETEALEIEFTPHFMDIDIYEPNIKQEIDCNEVEEKRKITPGKLTGSKNKMKRPLNVYICSLCPKKFDDIQNFNKHKLVHRKPFECKICKKKFSSLTAWGNHKHQNAESLFIGDVSLKKLRSSADLNKHKWTTESEKGKCFKMNNLVGTKVISFSSNDMNVNKNKTYNNSLTIHSIKTTHGNTNVPEDTNSFSSDTMINIVKAEPKEVPVNGYNLYEAKTFECTICSAKFYRLYHLNRHMDSHTGEKRYECSTCFKKFIRFEHLKRHFQIHTNDKRFQCSFCLVKFTRSEHLNRHMRLHCDKSKQIIKETASNLIIQSDDSERNAGVLSGESTHIESNHFADSTTTANNADIADPLSDAQESVDYDVIENVSNINNSKGMSHECDICKSTFHRANALARHKKTHSGLKPYECYICKKNFGRSEHLKRHFKIHMNEVETITFH